MLVAKLLYTLLCYYWGKREILLSTAKRFFAKQKNASVFHVKVATIMVVAPLTMITVFDILLNMDWVGIMNSFIALMI
jgi:hypothetical protein